ncbi:MAG: UDP-2,4-diacetamido-2,4,6-trideoxy-beta-L-altropyranose hydrolase [Burkholderiales bacterium]|jgi:UDP-2,4-diacetamido-2,4,6-trideoxy-beta-L-altropyranose hydrolase|nr:UDP-2,4-diacetamido-2,4,6-trideoxy-beta-L-altropyranose hydrolase [Burkholderiales bacterium]
MKVAIRADASIQIGTGHVMRCLTLADELRRSGAVVIFICYAHEGNLCDLIEQRGFRVSRLSEHGAVDRRYQPESAALQRDGDEINRRNESSVIEADWEEDAAQTRAAIGKVGRVDWVIVDSYALDARWEAELRSMARRIMAIDDLADRPHDCDLLLDQNFVEHYETRYDPVVGVGARLLLGPRYALLRREFLDTLDHPRRVWSGGPLRLFVFFGGTDPTSETMKALRALEEVKVPIQADVVVGAGNRQRSDIASRCADRGWGFHCQIENIAELMSLADVGLCASGATTWERCVLGLPSIVVSVAENQIGVARAVARAGAQTDLGWHEEVDESRFAEAIERMVSVPSLLVEMSAAGRALMGGRDFRGAAGVVTAMLS